MRCDHIIEGKSICLRPICEDDTDNIIRWRNSDHVRKYFIYQRLFDKDTHTAWLKEKVEADQVEQFIVVEKATGRDIGSVYLRNFDWDEKKAELGIFLGEIDCQGRGIGSEAIRLLTDYAFSELGIEKLMARILAENSKSRGAFDNAGYLMEAYLKDYAEINSERKDLILMRQDPVLAAVRRECN